MRRVRVVGDGTVEVEDSVEPPAEADLVVVKVMASAISGTERRYYDGDAPDPWAGLRDNTGHEGAGVVVKAGPGAGRVREGDRVALYGAYRHCGRCRHCLSGRWLFCQDETRPPQAAGYHAQYVQIRADFCLPLPDEVGFEAGALLAAPFGSALRALRRIRLAGGERVLVAGQGPLGLATTLLATHLGAEVIASEPNPFRRDLASACGARAVVDPGGADPAAAVRASAGPDGVEAAVDCTGLEGGRLDCLTAVGPGGRVAFLGSGGGLALAPAIASQIVVREIELSGSWYADPAEVLALAQLVRRGFDPTRIVTHRFAIDDAQAAFAAAFGSHAGKVVIQPWS